MSAWAPEELDRIGSTDELQLASLHGDGSLSEPVTIWVVRVGNELFVRSAYGQTSHWFRGVRRRHEGHVDAGGVGKDVAFEETVELADAIDDAYRKKYGDRYPAAYVDPMLISPARDTTLRLVPV